MRFNENGLKVLKKMIVLLGCLRQCKDVFWYNENSLFVVVGKKNVLMCLEKLIVDESISKTWRLLGYSKRDDDGHYSD